MTLWISLGTQISRPILHKARKCQKLLDRFDAIPRQHPRHEYLQVTTLVYTVSQN